MNSQQLENHIKKEAIERSQLIQAVPSSEETKLPSSEPRTSVSIACGAEVFEVYLKAPSWAQQVLDLDPCIFIFACFLLCYLESSFCFTYPCYDT